MSNEVKGSVRALTALGRALRAAGYDFVTVTPETHARVVARARPRAASLRDVFGWSRPFDRRGVVPASMIDLLAEAGALVESNDGLSSAVRFSSLDGELFVHSAYPTRGADDVFFGPDTYRFAAAVARLPGRSARTVDVGCGGGAGGIVARKRGAERVVLADVNERALLHARVNAALAGVTEVEILKSDVLSGVEGPFDRVIANPPYMKDELHRTYRDGGGAFGEALAVRILRESLARLAAGGTLLLYTGAAVVDGRDVFLDAATPVLAEAGARFRYEEIDPDVFGDELARPSYAKVERIAAVALSVTRA